jgi:murein L,D-transpeptidase YcbB/YkuD
VALEKVLSDLHAQREQGGWPKVPSRAYKAGEEDPSVVTLRERLAASGELTGAGASSGSALYDAEMAAAVRSFQEHHGIKATGVLDKAALAAMNVPMDDRIRQVEINLERWRWMPDDFGPRHFVVNIPSYLLMARENGKTVLDIRVVVGKPGHETPIFSSDMANVVFSPYWNVPDSIAEGETAPAAALDPGYLTRNNMDIFRVSKSGTKRVDESEVNWGNRDELKKLVFRQRPGSRNALGRVKFLFPNPYNVYLHDTPADSLFARTGRAFSHGCVRVEEPEALAKYVLRGDVEWDEPRILAAMRSGAEKYVKLKETIPVHIVYFTVWLDESKGVHFQPDVYGYDAKQMKLFAIPD